MESVKSKTIEQHVKSTTEIAVPVQTITTFFGVILSYYYPEMPIDVLLAYTGLFGILFNILYISIPKLLARL